MKAIVLAAGKSSRFYPFSGFHKTMIEIAGKPILEHTLLGIKKAGIKEIVVVVGPDGIIKNYFADGKGLGLSIKYVVQKEPTGMGDALLCAEKYINDEFIFLGGNRVDSELLIAELLSKKIRTTYAQVLVQKRPNPWEYGVVELDKDKVLSVVEKPKKGIEPSNYCIMSVYYLLPDFLKILKKTSPHQYNFEEALNITAKKKRVQAIIARHEILTLKYPWDLLEVKNYLLKSVKSLISSKAKIAKSAEIIGDVTIEEGGQILEGVRIKGPCYVGKNVVVGNHALIRNGCDIEEDCVIGAYMEVKNSLVMKGTKTHSGFIGDSIIGQDCRIGAQFSTANVRLDRGSVKSLVNGQRLDTGYSHFGAIVGNSVHIGVKASTMPGVIIGNNAIIGPSTVVLKNVLDNTKYYTKFAEVVEKK